MDEKMIALLREWLRGNLIIEVDEIDKSGPVNTVTVGLRFVGDRSTFGCAQIYIPES